MFSCLFIVEALFPSSPTSPMNARALNARVITEPSYNRVWGFALFVHIALFCVVSKTLLDALPFSLADAAVRANAETYSILDQSGSGGSSGGTIILASKKVHKQTHERTNERTNKQTHQHTNKSTHEHTKKQTNKQTTSQISTTKLNNS